jgi:hypothetical protein
MIASLARLAALALAALGLGLALAAADQPVGLALADRTVLTVDVTAIEVRNADTTADAYPAVGSRASVTYDQALRAWAAQRFAASGGSVNSLRITMRRGGIVEKLLPVTKGIAGWFKKEQGAEYTGSLDVEVAVIDPAGQVVTVADGKSWASDTVREDATAADKQAAWLGIVTKTFDNLDRELIPRMRQTMAAYVR